MRKTFLFLAFILSTVALPSGFTGGSSDTLGLACTTGQFPSWSGGGFNTCTTASGVGNVTGINSDETAAQTLSVGTTGTDFAIADNAAGDHKFNLPDAGASARGVVTTGTQTFAGTKTFSSTITGDVSGNAGTATALAADPADCGANTYATTIAASGALTCASVTNASTTASASAGNNTIVTRDGSGNFAAGTITANLTGNASGTAGTFTGNLTGAVTSSGMATSIIDHWSGHMDSPSDKIYGITPYAPFSGTINYLRSKTLSGTGNVSIQINGVNVTGIASEAFSATLTSETASAGNVFAVGDRISIVVDSGSTPVDYDWDLQYTRP